MSKEPFFDVWFINDHTRTRSRGTATQRFLAWVIFMPILVIVVPAALAVEWWGRRFG